MQNEACSAKRNDRKMRFAKQHAQSANEFAKQQETMGKMTLLTHLNNDI